MTATLHHRATPPATAVLMAALTALLAPDDGAAAGVPSPLGGEFQVNTYTSGTQRDPAVAIDAGGTFVVVWESDGSGDTDSSGYSVQGQRYTSGGVPLGGQFHRLRSFQKNALRPGRAVEGPAAYGAGAGRSRRRGSRSGPRGHSRIAGGPSKRCGGASLIGWRRC